MAGGPATGRVGIALMPLDDGADERAARRHRLANTVLPGAGVVGEDRPWLGLGLGLAFWWPLAGALYLSWIGRGLARPAWAIAFGLVAVAGYLANQVVLGRILVARSARRGEYAARVSPVLQAAYEAMSRGDWVAAQLQLDGVLAFDPEHFEANLMQARLLAIQGKFDRAVRAYARCRKLDGGGRWDWEISRELSLLPQERS